MTSINPAHSFDPHKIELQTAKGKILTVWIIINTLVQDISTIFPCKKSRRKEDEEDINACAETFLQLLLLMLQSGTSLEEHYLLGIDRLHFPFIPRKHFWPTRRREAKPSSDRAEDECMFGKLGTEKRKEEGELQRKPLQFSAWQRIDARVVFFLNRASHQGALGEAF